jgi:hypothetical protein
MPKPLHFNEGRACEAVVRHIERREAAIRTDVHFPEQEGHLAPVELVCTIDRQLYAFEHTGIEPFEGHLRGSAQVDWLINPIVSGVTGRLPPSDDFELHIPVRAMERVRSQNVAAVQQHLIQWIIETAPTLRRPPPGRSDTSIRPRDVPGVPFPVRLYRLAELVIRPGQLQVVHVVSELEEQRAVRIATALAKKMPKLAKWKKEGSARTVLILEENDIQLTNCHFVTDAVLKAEQTLGHVADEIYLVTTSFTPWQVHHVRVDKRTYFDLTDPDERSWDADPTGLTSLTGR